MTAQERINNFLQCIYADSFMLLEAIRASNKLFLALQALLLILLSPILLILSFVALWYFFARGLATKPSKPQIFGCEKFKGECLQACPSLGKIYVPPLVWGTSGLLQSFLVSSFGRFDMCWKMPDFERRFYVTYDGTTLPYDILEPIENKSADLDLTLIIIPGFGENSRKHYFRTTCQRYQNEGIRTVIINQPAFTPGFREFITSPIVVNFNDTKYLGPIVNLIAEKYPKSKLVLIGQSFGTAVTTKYVGFKDKLQPSLCGLISAGSIGSIESLSSCDNFLGNLILPRVFAEFLKVVIIKHRNLTLTDEIKSAFDVDEAKLLAAKNVRDVLDNSLRKIQGFETLESFLKDANVAENIQNVSVPLVVFHAEDDPLLPKTINEFKPIIESRENSLLVTTKHGGHIAYYTGGILFPSKKSWIDDAVIEVAQFLAKKSQNKK